jgi:hypothetical protein
MKLKIKEYITGLALSFFWYLLLISIIGVITTFIIIPVFIFVKTGIFIFLPDMDFTIKIIKGTIACSFSVSFLVYNLQALNLYADGNDK